MNNHTIERYASPKLLFKLLLVFAVLLSGFGSAYRAYADAPPAGDPLLTEAQAAMEGAAQSIAGLSSIGDWQAVGLTGAGKPIPSRYVSKLYQTLVAAKGSFASVTDYERTVIGLTAANQDATQFAGYDLIERIYNSDIMENQGLNGPLYALIALDSGRYSVPSDALWTRDKLVAAILAKQKDDGGFTLFGSVSDPDITAMTLTALAPYAADAAVQTVVGEAVDWLSGHQQDNGGYLSWGADASESVSQAIIALASHGIDPTEGRFTKNGVNLVQKLLAFRKADGTFSHTPDTGSSGMATEQALQALDAYVSYKSGGNRLYDFGARQPYGWPAKWILGASWFDTEWQAVAVSRAGLKVPDSYLATLPSLEFVKAYPEYAYVTDYERIAIALSALRQDATDFNGFNVIERIYNSDVMEAQGINGLDFGLIALDGREYATPSDAKWDREKLLAAILAKQNADGGFALTDGASDPDLTAMTLTALAPYMDRADVKTAGERAVQWLSANQQANGGYLSSGADSSEGVAQAIIALSSNGIDPTGEAFTKNGITLIDKLFAFFQPDGGFVHVADPQAATDFMATEQAQQALTAYEMYVHGTGRLYQMGALPPTVPVQVEGPDGTIAEGSAAGGNAFEALQRVLQEKQVPISASDTAYGKYVSAIGNITAGSYGELDGWLYDVYRDGHWSFPAVSIDAYELQPNDRLLVYYGGEHTQLAESVAVAPSSPKAGEPFTVTVKQTASVWNGTSSEVVTSAAAGVKVSIDGAVQQTNEDGVASFGAGIANKGSYTLEVTGYETGHTPHIVRFAQPIVIAEGNGNGNGNGNGGTPVDYATLSVTGDSQRGIILAAKQTALQPGDTAYTILARELPGKVRAIGSGPTRYVQGIDGLSEFDRGSGSGWMYSVNGVFPNYSADSYTLKPNDVVAWRYTLDLGKDLGAPSDGGNSGGAPTGGTGGAGGGSSADTVIDVPKDQQQDYVLKAGKDQQGSITLNIPDAAPKVVLNVAEAKDGLPQLTANKGNLIFTIGKGTKLVSGGSAIELFAAMDTADAKLLALVDGSLTGDVSVDAIRQAFTMGAADQSFLFDAPLTITVKGGKGQLAGYIEGGVFTPIPLFASDEEGKQATKGNEKITYAYVDGSDLVIKTNHFTSFVTYTTKKQEQASVDLSKRYADADRISAWALESVKEATMQGFLQGSGGKLNPQAAVTRAEFVKLLVSALGIPADSGSSTSFKDVPGSAWYRPYVQAAYKAGFVTGDGDRFNPNDTITREQMAAMVVRALALDPAAGTAAPADLKKVSPWAQSAVQAILAAQIMNGEGSGFNPAGKVTREMAAVVAVRSQAYLHNGADPSGSGSGSSSDKGKQAAAERQIALTASYLQKTVPSPAVSTLGGEWTVLGLARSGLAIPASYYDAYEANLKQTLEAKSGVLHSVKYTEYDRVILALSAMGKSVTNAAGYSLLEKLADFDALTKQGINGPIFALIALDSKQYAIPAASGAKTQTTRELLVDYILKRHAGGGGWALGEGSASDPDVTAMAIQALAPYAGSSKEVRSAIDEALAWLSANQQADGGFVSNGANNAESAAQVVVALTGLGIDPHADARFVKNGHSAIDALLGFAAADGGFYHVKTGEAGNGGAAPGVEDPMAADQSMYALVAYDRLLKGQTRLYDMTDVKAVL